jgi:hypothetical protein
MFSKILKKRNTYLKSITKIVKIVKSSKEYGWYNNSIGLKLEVFNDVDKKYFITKYKIPGNNINKGFILKKDTIK